MAQSATAYHAQPQTFFRPVATAPLSPRSTSDNVARLSLAAPRANARLNLLAVVATTDDIHMHAKPRLEALVELFSVNPKEGKGGTFQYHVFKASAGPNEVVFTQAIESNDLYWNTSLPFGSPGSKFIYRNGQWVETHWELIDENQHSERQHYIASPHSENKFAYVLRRTAVDYKKQRWPNKASKRDLGAFAQRSAGSGVFQVRTGVPESTYLPTGADVRLSARATLEASTIPGPLRNSDVGVAHASWSQLRDDVSSGLETFPARSAFEAVLLALQSLWHDIVFTDVKAVLDACDESEGTSDELTPPSSFVRVWHPCLRTRHSGWRSVIAILGDLSTAKTFQGRGPADGCSVELSPHTFQDVGRLFMTEDGPVDGAFDFVSIQHRGSEARGVRNLGLFLPVSLTVKFPIYHLSGTAVDTFAAGLVSSIWCKGSATPPSFQCLSSNVVETYVHGDVIALFWPGSPANICKLLRIQLAHSSTGSPLALLVSCIMELSGLQVMRINRPCTLVLPAGTISSRLCLSISASVHATVADVHSLKALSTTWESLLKCEDDSTVHKLLPLATTRALLLGWCMQSFTKSEGSFDHAPAADSEAVREIGDCLAALVKQVENRLSLSAMPQDKCELTLRELQNCQTYSPARDHKRIASAACFGVSDVVADTATVTKRPRLDP